MFAWFFEFFLWCTADELLISDLWPHELVCTCDTLASRRLPCLVLTCRVAFPRRVLRLCFTSPGVGWTSPRVVNSILGLVVAISLTVPTFARVHIKYVISPFRKMFNHSLGCVSYLIFNGFYDECFIFKTVIDWGFRYSWIKKAPVVRLWCFICCFVYGRAFAFAVWAYTIRWTSMKLSIGQTFIRKSTDIQSKKICFMNEWTFFSPVKIRI